MSRIYSCSDRNAAERTLFKEAPLRGRVILGGAREAMGQVRVQITDGILDPILPAALRRHLSDSDWTVLQQALTYEFRPAVNHNSCASTTTSILMVCLVCGFVSVFFTGVLGFCGNVCHVRLDLSCATIFSILGTVHSQARGHCGCTEGT